MLESRFGQTKDPAWDADGARDGVLLGGFGPLLIVGMALDLAILGTLGIHDDLEQFGLFPVGVAVGGLLTLSGFALWLTLKKREFGGSEPQREDMKRLHP